MVNFTFPQGILSTPLVGYSGVSLPSPVLRWPISIFQKPCLKRKFSGGQSQYFKSLFFKKFSGAAAAWEANARLGGRLQLWNHVKLLSRTALWPGDHKDSLKHFFTALTCIHRGICCQYLSPCTSGRSMEWETKNVSRWIFFEIGRW